MERGDFSLGFSKVLFSSVKGKGRKCSVSSLTFLTYFCFEEPLYIHVVGCRDVDSFSWKLEKSQGKAKTCRMH